MNALTLAVSRLKEGSLRAFKAFPAAMVCALFFAIVTIIRINLDWPQQEPYNFLFNSLHWSLALGAIFSLAAITAAQSRYENDKAVLLANILGFIAAGTAFLLLYFLGEAHYDPAARYAMISDIAAARVTVAMIVSFLCFMVLAGYPEDQSDFAHSSVMNLKAFFIALLYGGVIMGGLSGVAGSVQALLYNDMSEKVYMYLATLSGFLAFAIFVGYFPDFRKGRVDESREEAQAQPRFLEILFGSIMVPIMMALTVVLLLWTIKTLITGVAVPFQELSGIATSYAVVGIWLHIMITHHESNLAQFYRRFYPYAALLILTFEARSLFMQISASGVKTTEYWFLMIWIMAVVGSVWLIVKKAKAHNSIVALTCVLGVISILPASGYHSLPVMSQVNRLENLLISQNMLKEGQMVAAATEPNSSVRESITDAVQYLAYAKDAKLPSWFDKKLSDDQTFKAKLGFEKTWPEPKYFPGTRSQYMATSLYRSEEAVDISGYKWAVNPEEKYTMDQKQPNMVKGERGTYQIYWSINPPNGIPSLKIVLDDRTIMEEDLNEYIDRISKAYPPGSKMEPIEGSVEDMSVRLETPEVEVLLVFNNIEIGVDPREDRINYGFGLHALYMNEKP
ncbi:MAG: DUF4153 domain-containing protein [Ignavibacteriales bacterium]